MNDRVRFEGVAHWQGDDTGDVLMISLEGESVKDDCGESVELFSWRSSADADPKDPHSMRQAHPLLGVLIDKRIRVTVEVLDD